MKCQSFLLLVLMLMLDARAEQPSAQSTIVLYNKVAPDSVELAKFYAEQRGIAADHLAGLNCSTEEEISREEYNTTIAGPLREIFKQRHWWMLSESTDKPPAITSSEIHFVGVHMWMGGTAAEARETWASNGSLKFRGNCTKSASR